MSYRFRVLLALLCALSAVTLTVGLIAALGATLWQEDGMGLSVASNEQKYPQIVSDGSRGAIVTWADLRSNIHYDIYAQRVDRFGNVLWTVDGVSLCVASNIQYSPQIVSDGSGGAIVTWYDDRTGWPKFDIYAQRVYSDSSTAWQDDGVALCVASNEQYDPQIVTDGSGGGVVTWKDYRSGSHYDIYAQRVYSDGIVVWTADGVSLSVASGEQEDPQIVSDGSGGAIVTWKDLRGTDADIYAQRVDWNGTVLWSPDGVSLCVAYDDQLFPQIASDGSGGAFVTWQDHRDTSTTKYDIYAQRVYSDGTVAWVSDGVSLCAEGGYQFAPQIASDGSGGAFVTWQDKRLGSGYYDIYAQRVDGDGNTLWYTDGVSLCAASDDQWHPEIALDGSGGALLTWKDYRSGSHYDIYAQRVDGDGNTLWTPDGVSLCVASNDQEYPQIISDGSGGAIVTWQDRRSGSLYDIYAQRVGARYVNLPLVMRKYP